MADIAAFRSLRGCVAVFAVKRLFLQLSVVLPWVYLGAALAEAAGTPSWVQGGSKKLFDDQGNMYVAGTVQADTIPVTPGAFQTKFNGGICGTITIGFHPPVTQQIPCVHIFAAKLSPDGAVLYATYLEGSGSEQLSSTVIDSAGHLFLAGQYSSPDFPATGGISGLPPAGTSGGFFVAELSANGSSLVFSDTFSTDFTSIAQIALDAQGNVYVAGTTNGTAFPTTAGTYLHARPDASLDGFVFQLNPATASLIFSTLLGGSDVDYLTGLAVDSAGDIAVVGYTASADFPVTAGAFVHSVARENIFVAKLDPAASSLQFSSLFGGTYNSVPSAIAVDRSGDVFVDGWTYASDLPTSPGAFETAPPPGEMGNTPAFLARFDGKTGARVYLTYFGDPHAYGGPLFPAPDGTVWAWGNFSGPSIYGPPVLTPDALAPCVTGNVYTQHSDAKHFSADGTQLLYGTLLDGMLSLDASGVARVSDSASLYRTIDLAAPQPPHITCVVNAATLSGPIAPGEIITLFGPSIGPDTPSGYQLAATGLVSSDLDGLQVLVGGLAAPILYASRNQINVVTPFGVPSAGNVTVGVVKSGAVVSTFSATTAPASPGIFTQNGEGSGPRVILNQNGSLNGPGNPAAPGSTLSIYVTGIGPLTPQPLDGFIPATPTAKPVLPLQVWLSSSLNSLTILYAGDAPQMVEGVQRIDVQLPTVLTYYDPPQIFIVAGGNPSSSVPVFFQ